MAGWREVCDECLTTLFNYHYMCTQCGYMICIECSNQLSQTNLEKRKSTDEEICFAPFNRTSHLELKRFCTHENAYALAELIPWESRHFSPHF